MFFDGVYVKLVLFCTFVGHGWRKTCIFWFTWQSKSVISSILLGLYKFMFVDSPFSL